MFCKFEKYRRYFGIYQYFYRFFRKFLEISYQSSPRTGFKICPIFFFLNKNIRCYLVISSWFAGKGYVFQSGSKIVDLGFVKFKSNGIKAKRPLEQIQKHREPKKKKHFFLFSSGFCMDFLGNQTRMNFPGNQMGDGFSWESNGGCKKIIIIITWLD